MTVHASQRPVFGAPVDLSPEAIERHLAEGRRQRSEVIVGGVCRGFAALRRWLSGEPRGYGVSGGART